MLEDYCKKVNIEARTMLEMAKVDILPAVFQYESILAGTLNAKKAVSDMVPCRAEKDLLIKISSLADMFYDRIENLQKATDDAADIKDRKRLALYYRDAVCLAMESLREVGDTLEVHVGSKYWPYPSYGTLLYRV